MQVNKFVGGGCELLTFVYFDSLQQQQQDNKVLNNYIWPDILTNVSFLYIYIFYILY
jgi:hypothetical protein